jgi:hypothetical protein
MLLCYAVFNMKPENTAAAGQGKAVFAPQTLGLFVLLIIILSFAAGAVRQELALTLSGAVFLAVWLYCLVMTLLSALIHYRRVRRVSIRLSPHKLRAGERTAALYSERDEIAHNGAHFQMPGILIRCRVLLATRDGRRIAHDFKPGRKKQAAAAQAETFEVKLRGAYFSAYDEFAVFDAPGFFRFAWRIPQEAGARLLASPGAADEPAPVNARSGESNRQPEVSFLRTDNLIDHRPYVPGDDPRRINWKLYGHGGELFVREGEREPPPHSTVAILIDSQYDPLLYSAGAARRGVDLLCENALAAALAMPGGVNYGANYGADSGPDVLIGCTGSGGFTGGQSAESLAAALAWPAALPLSAQAELPAAPEGRGMLIFALPRAAAAPSALDRFLREHASRAAGRTNAPTAEIIFVVSAGAENGGAEKRGEAAYSERQAAAEVCAALYNQRQGVKARVLEV